MITLRLIFYPTSHNPQSCARNSNGKRRWRATYEIACAFPSNGPLDRGIPKTKNQRPKYRSNTKMVYFMRSWPTRFNNVSRYSYDDTSGHVIFGWLALILKPLTKPIEKHTLWLLFFPLLAIAEPKGEGSPCQFKSGCPLPKFNNLHQLSARPDDECAWTNCEGQNERFSSGLSWHTL